MRLLLYLVLITASESVNNAEGGIEALTKEVAKLAQT
jgi:hypothetical protein